MFLLSCSTSILLNLWRISISKRRVYIITKVINLNLSLYLGFWASARLKTEILIKLLVLKVSWNFISVWDYLKALVEDLARFVGFRGCSAAFAVDLILRLLIGIARSRGGIENKFW